MQRKGSHLRFISRLCWEDKINSKFKVAVGDFIGLEGKYLESFEVWCWRRIERIKWSEKVTNEQVLDLIGEKRTLISNILHRKANWMSYSEKKLPPS